MLVVAWFWAISTVFAPVNVLAMTVQALDAQTETIDAVARPLMALGWVDEDDAPIF